MIYNENCDTVASDDASRDCKDYYDVEDYRYFCDSCKKFYVTIILPANDPRIKELLRIAI